MSDLTTFQIDKDTVSKLEAIAKRNGWSKQAQIRHWCEMDSILQKAVTISQPPVTITQHPNTDGQLELTDLPGNARLL
jgi:predicted urease superfamily metal-dependent hydrolase